MKRRSVSSERSSMRWPSLAVPSVSRLMICVCPRRKSAEPCVRGATPTSPERGQSRADLHLADDVLLGRGHRERRGELLLELGDDGARLADADRLDALPDGVPVVALDLGVQLAVEPLRLADPLREVFLRLAELPDLGLRDVERLEQAGLRHLVRA